MKKTRIKNDFTADDKRRFRASLWTAAIAAVLLVGCYFTKDFFGGTHRSSHPSHRGEPAWNEAYHDHREPYRNYPSLFADLQETQIAAAMKNGLKGPVTRQQLADGMDGMVRIDDCDRYALDPLTHSAPYLVPKAATFLDNLGKAFQDSLYNRGYNRNHRFIVTSVTRTQDDVQRLSRQNANATENSCHLYGTTVDISYVRFSKPDDHVADDIKLKELLMQAVYDQQRAGRVYVKYERKQSCLHMTVR